jgi:hypothetical protein
MRGHLRRLLMVATIACAGCGGDGTNDEPTPDPDPDPTVCGPGDRALTGCGERCPAGEVAQPDGGCIPAGIPAELCADGFVSDAGACRPTLGSNCGFAEQVVLGQTGCLPIDSCGSGTWGDIPTDGDMVYVDAAADPNGDGTTGAPFDTISAAVAGAAPGARIALAAGSYDEDLVLTKTVHIHGRCAEMVQLAGISAIATVFFQRDGSLSDLSVTGPQLGVAVSGAENVRLERIHIHDTGWRGLDVENVLGPTAVHMIDSLVENAAENGVYTNGSTLLLEGSVVRGTVAQMGDSRGINVQADIPGQVPSDVTLLRSVVEHNPGAGIRVWGSNLDVQQSVIRDTTPNAAGGFGRAIDAYTDPASRSNVVIDASVIERAVTTGIHTEGDAAISATTIVDVAHEPETMGFGRCIGASDAPNAARSTLALTHSVLERCVGGVMVDGDAEAILTGVLVRDMMAGGVESARGLQVQGSVEGLRASALVYGSVIAGAHEAAVVVDTGDAYLDGLRISDTLGAGVIAQTTVLPVGHATLMGSLVERSTGMGVAAIGGAITLHSSIVRDVAPDQLGIRARGVTAQYSILSMARGSLDMFDSSIEGTQEAGVLVMGGDAVINASLIRNTQSLPGGTLGDGVAVSALLFGNEPVAASANILGLVIEDSQRAGVSAFGADVALTGSSLSCQGFDLNGESLAGIAHSFEDGGGNACGCPEPVEGCKSVSAGLSPPEAAPEM